jgi:hypothetical protein
MPQIPVGQSSLAHLLLDGQADLFLAYYSSCQETLRVASSLQVLELLPDLAVTADFGLTILAGAAPMAAALALYILSQEGQTIQARHGFDAPLIPASPVRQ